uniref:Uncharacterized protein n=1 Tax=Setaria italica TaxID=4555 RepID=K3YM11_SETIT
MEPVEGKKPKRVFEDRQCEPVQVVQEIKEEMMFEDLCVSVLFFSGTRSLFNYVL